MTDVRVPRTSGSRRARSSWAVGWTYFASVMMLLIGIFQSIAGLIWALTAHGRDVSNDGY